MSFEGASVAVTGGSRGIGKAIALRFATLGASRVAIGYMRGDKAAEDTAAELTKLGVEPVLLRGNVASQRIADEVAALGTLDVLVHAAATGVMRPALETVDKHWDWTLSANARALLSLTRAAAPSMPAGASILGISSLGSSRVLDNYSLVGASKAALEALVRYLAVELAPRGIRVNASRQESSRPAPSSTFRTRSRCSRWAHAIRLGGSSRPRTSRRASRSSALLRRR